MKNIGDSFSFIFKDTNWATKVLIGAIFSFLSIFLIGIPVVYGYGVTVLQRVRRGEQNPVPEWKDVGVLFIKGIKYLVTLLIYYLPIMILSLPIIILIVFGLINGVTLLELIEGSIIISIVFFFILLYTLFIVILTPLISILFAERESILDGLQLGKIFSSFKCYWQDVLILAALVIALDILASLGFIFFLIGIFFTSFYVTLVRFHLYGQIGRSIQERLTI